MTSDFAIAVAQIRAALGMVLDAVERDHGSELTFEHDYYWNLPVASSFDVTEPDPTLTAGQLSEDIAETRGLVIAAEVVAPWHDLAHLVGVLRAVEDLCRP